MKYTDIIGAVSLLEALLESGSYPDDQDTITRAIELVSQVEITVDGDSEVSAAFLRIQNDIVYALDKHLIARRNLNQDFRMVANHIDKDLHKLDEPQIISAHY